MTSQEVLSRFVAAWTSSLTRVRFEIEETPIGWTIRTWRYPPLGHPHQRAKYCAVALTRSDVNDAVIDTTALLARKVERDLASTTTPKLV